MRGRRKLTAGEAARTTVRWLDRLASRGTPRARSHSLSRLRRHFQSGAQHVLSQMPKTPRFGGKLPGRIRGGKNSVDPAFQAEACGVRSPFPPPPWRSPHYGLLVSCQHDLAHRPQPYRDSHTTAQISCSPDRPFNSTTRLGPHGTSEPCTSAFSTADTRISPPCAWEATRAATMTLRP